jgi:hypothetical protein
MQILMGWRLLKIIWTPVRFSHCLLQEFVMLLCLMLIGWKLLKKMCLPVTLILYLLFLGLWLAVLIPNWISNAL